jgi:heparosan-N-sulfate-glucuronate 5-epimerase
MTKTFRKIGLYFRNTGTYWQLSQEDTGLTIDTKPLRSYPLDLTARLITGHYDRFDETGLPIRPSKFGPGYTHDYTTLCSFALGHWNFYLQTGKELYLSNTINVSDFIVRTAELSAGDAILLRCEGRSGKHSGPISAMVQGEAMSVLCRAWQVTNERRYLEIALGCLKPFDRGIEDGGVLGNISVANIPWYEEYPTLPLNHVLNGMIYSLWGLSDLNATTGNSRAQELFDLGVDSIVRALPLFDNGYWSMYRFPEAGDPYVASMMYHNLHICQLTALYQQTKREELHQFATIFAEYARRPLCRMRAAASISQAKFLYYWTQRGNKSVSS